MQNFIAEADNKDKHKKSFIQKPMLKIVVFFFFAKVKNFHFQKVCASSTCLHY